MIILSVDLGKERTGIALCDKKEILAYPLKVIKENNFNKLAKKVEEEVIKNNVELVIIGLPKNMNGSIGQSTQRSISFQNILKKILKVDVELWDERQTTILANQFLNLSNVRGQKRKNIIDALSASIILQSFIDFRKNKKI